MEELKRMIASLKLYTPKKEHCLVRLEPQLFDDVIDKLGGEFTSITRTKDETSIILEKEAWQARGGEFPNAQVEEDYWLISFDAKLDLNIVGFLSEITKTLAGAGIGVLVISTHDTDHLLVKGEKLGAAKKVIKELVKRFG
jgi:hypothetical protein